jgi:hypothetical protein
MTVGGSVAREGVASDPGRQAGAAQHLASASLRCRCMGVRLSDLPSEPTKSSRWRTKSPRRSRRTTSARSTSCSPCSATMNVEVLPRETNPSFEGLRQTVKIRIGVWPGGLTYRQTDPAGVLLGPVGPCTAGLHGAAACDAQQPERRGTESSAGPFGATGRLATLVRRYRVTVCECGTSSRWSSGHGAIRNQNLLTDPWVVSPAW